MVEVAFQKLGIGMINQLGMKPDHFQHTLWVADLQSLFHHKIHIGMRQDVSVAEIIRIGIDQGANISRSLRPLDHVLEVLLRQADVAAGSVRTTSHQVLEVGCQISIKLIDFVVIVLVEFWSGFHATLRHEKELA